VAARSVLYQGEAASQVMFHDISQRKIAEQKLRQSEANLAAAQAIAHVGNWSWEIIDDVLSWSAEMFQIYGVSPEEFDLKPASVRRLIHPEDASRCEKFLIDMFADRAVDAFDYRIVRPDGSERIVRVLGGAVARDAKGLPVRASGVVLDITEHKKAEERFSKAFHANPEPMTIATLAEGRYVDANESFLRVTGYSREETIGRTSLDLKFWASPEERAKFVDILEKQGSVRDLEVTFQAKSGEQRSAVDSAEIIEIGGEKCIIAIFKDVTEQKHLEKRLRQAQKMEAIGQLSGGIAHDFNNLLGVIIGYSELLEERLSENSAERMHCERIKKAGQSAASLTRQLLAFSRQQVLEPKIVDLNVVVRNVEKMLRRLIGEDIDVRTEMAPVLGRVRADEGQIEQVIMNLAVNARDAMPQGGRLTIETANVELDEDYARRHAPQPPGRYILLAISDTGMGMDAATQSRIFEPFFTTKELGKGTGLGLSTVYGVVRQSLGHIWVYSEVGLGTTFKIYLPRIEGKILEEKPTTSVASSLRGTETVLLVEDDPSLRELTLGILATSGYTVLEADSPDSAMEIDRQHSGLIHLLLTDMVMPGMNGQMLAGKLTQARPNMKVIYMSGYTGFAYPKIFDADAALLPKPFTRVALLRKVHDVLASSMRSEMSIK
jgi:PAS domain S-box-containing protein